MKSETSFRVFFLKQHRKNSLKNIFSHQKVYFWISAFDHRAIVVPKMHIVRWWNRDSWSQSIIQNNIWTNLRCKCFWEKNSRGKNLKSFLLKSVAPPIFLHWIAKYKNISLNQIFRFLCRVNQWHDLYNNVVSFMRPTCTILAGVQRWLDDDKSIAKGAMNLNWRPCVFANTSSSPTTTCIIKSNFMPPAVYKDIVNHSTST